MSHTMKRASEDVQSNLRQFQQRNMALSLRAITTMLAVCFIGSTLLFASCSTQNGIVNPVASTWKIVPGKNPGAAQNSLNAIAATSVNDAWAVGAYSSSHFDIQGTKSLIEHWNGSAWSVVKSPDTSLGNGILNGVAAISPTNAWAVGYAFGDNTNEQQTLIEHWDGTSWSTSASPNIGTNNTTLDGAGLIPHSTNIWAVGIGATYGAPVSVSTPKTIGTSNETPVTSQALIESCCS